MQLPDYAQIAVNVAFVLWYSMDLLNIGLDLSLGFLWAGLFACPSFINLMLFFVFNYASEEHDGSIRDILKGCVLNLMECGIQNILWLALVGFMMLQYEHFSPKNDPHYSLLVKLCLYTCLPILSSTIVVRYESDILSGYSPAFCYIVLLIVNTGILTKFSDASQVYARVKDEDQHLAKDIHIFQLVLWICVPIVTHCVTFWKFILSDMFDVYDLIIAALFPLVMLMFFSRKNLIWWCSQSSYFSRNDNARACNLIISILYLSFQQRYIVPLCLDWQFYMHGGVSEHKSSILISSMLTIGMIFVAASHHIYHYMTDYIGEYTEDVSLGFISLGIISQCMAMGLPWTVMPSVVLAVVAIALFYVSKQVRRFIVYPYEVAKYLRLTFFQVRYLLIFLVVFSLSLAVMIMFRVAFLRSITIAGISLLRFGYMAIFAAVLIGFVIGFTFRAPGGWGSKAHFDSVGVIMFGYTLTLTFLESALVGSQFSNSFNSLKYPFPFSMLTSVLLLLSVQNLRNEGKVSQLGLCAIISLSLGKLASYLSYYDEYWRGYCISRAFLSSCLLFFIGSPHIFVKNMENGQNHFMASNKVRLPSTNSKKRIEASLIVLPFALISSSVLVLKPLLQCLYSILDRNKREISVLEVIGFCLVIWGLNNLTIFIDSDFLGKGFTKSSSILFLLGVLARFSGPSLLVFDDFRANDLLEGGIVNGTGVHLSNSWIFIFMIIIISISFGGPLDFRPSSAIPRRAFSQVKALIFSGALSASLFLLLAHNDIFNEGIISVVLPYANSMLGVYVAVYYRYCEDHLNPAGVISWAMASAITCLQSFLVSHKSVGCSLLSLDGIILFFVSVSLKQRSVKVPALINLANYVIISSWIVSSFVSYFLFGLMDEKDSVMNRIFGVPISLVGSILGSVCLLFFEKDCGHESRVATSFRQSTGKGSISPFVVGNCVTLFIVSTYIIFIRGCISTESMINTKIEMEGISLGLARVMKKYDVSMAGYLIEASFCTSNSLLQPIIYSISLVFACPILYLLLCSLKNKVSPQNSKMMLMSMPFCFLSLILSRGFVHLFMLNLFAIIGGTFEIYLSRRRQRNRDMRI